MKKIIEDDFGKLEWIDTGEGSGYFRRIEDEEMAAARVPHVCPTCSELMDNWGVPFYHRNGVCANCAIRYLENQINGQWVSRFPEGHFKTRNDRVEYVKTQILEKQKRILSEKNNI